MKKALVHFYLKYFLGFMQVHLKVLLWRKYLTIKLKKQSCDDFFSKVLQTPRTTYENYDTLKRS